MSSSLCSLPILARSGLGLSPRPRLPFMPRFLSLASGLSTYNPTLCPIYITRFMSRTELSSSNARDAARIRSKDPPAGLSGVHQTSSGYIGRVCRGYRGMSVFHPFYIGRGLLLMIIVRQLQLEPSPVFHAASALLQGARLGVDKAHKEIVSDMCGPGLRRGQSEEASEAPHV
ncbi:hypothetical protein C8F04DRAFT_1111446 [Mycena alexandri]|uniref:Uncharacterized protein n=1 Tax=Mycena alexandri TaxID=1745969 RepID=A0AAD6SNN2_9AGAR|nr:hypothetical protein C8F04DRAFT_1111446 [Mycena alexandri]